MRHSRAQNSSSVVVVGDIAHLLALPEPIPTKNARFRTSVCGKEHASCPSPVSFAVKNRACGTAPDTSHAVSRRGPFVHNRVRAAGVVQRTCPDYAQIPFGDGRSARGRLVSHRALNSAIHLSSLLNAGSIVQLQGSLMAISRICK